MVEKKPSGLWNVEIDEQRQILLSDELAWLKGRINKFVEGGIYLISGEPGIGKTSLALQIALDLGRQEQKTLYIFNEMSKSELSIRAKMLASSWEISEKDKENIIDNNVLPVGTEDGVYDVTSLPNFLSHQVIGKSGMYHLNPKLIVIDSIQGQGLSSAATKQYKQIYDFCNRCKKERITTLLIAHVTKRGEISGPKDLQHNVDCIMAMKKAFIYRPMFIPKNRFGPSFHKAIPLEMDKNTRLHLSKHVEVESSVARTFMGRGLGVVEIQVAVSLPTFGTRGKITAPYLPRKEIEQILECINQLPELDVSDLSLTIQVRIPGGKPYMPTMFGFPLSMALISAYLQIEIPKHHIYLGEIDLQNRVRGVPDKIIEELWDALEAGEIGTPLRIFAPEECAPVVREGMGEATVIACDNLKDALVKTWPDIYSSSST